MHFSTSTRWYNERPSWLREDDISADPLGDLATNENTLSVWHVEEDKSNLDQVVTALAASSDNISNLDYALFDRELLSEFSIKINPSQGGSPDEKTNTFWHFDLIELSALKLVELAKAMLVKAERKQVSEKMILQLIAQAIVSKQNLYARL